MIGCTEEGRRHLEKLQDEEMARIEEEEFPYFWKQCTNPDVNNCDGATPQSATSITLLINNKCDDVMNGDKNCSEKGSARSFDARCDHVSFHDLLNAPTKPYQPPTPLRHKTEALKKLRAARYKTGKFPERD